MHSILETIQNEQRSLAILIDPEKTLPSTLNVLILQIQKFAEQAQKRASVNQLLLFVGGSTMRAIDFDSWVKSLSSLTQIPIVIFPGSHEQLSESARGLLFLNLLSGRNPDYLVTQQVQAANKLKGSKLEIIPTAYLLLDGGKETAVQRVSQTTPISQEAIETITDTAFAGQLMGNKLIYLEAGSGALRPVSPEVIKVVCETVSVPVLAGGGIRDFNTMNQAYEAGASVVVVGTAIEDGEFSYEQ